MNLPTTMTGLAKRCSAAIFALLLAVSAQAATVNFSSIEQLLAEPDDMMTAKTVLWTGWTTSLFEANMPFVEVTVDEDDPALDQFTMTIGDTAYGFSTEFANKEWTNSFPFAADGNPAVLGYSTPDVEFTSSVTDGGDTLVIDFGDGGLQPGETVRFQVDIDTDVPGSEGTMLYADFTSVFFNNGDDEQNSFISFDFANTDLDASGFLNDVTIPTDISQFFQNPRPYSIEQTPPDIPTTPFERIPEPTGFLLVTLAAVATAARHRG